MMQLQLVVLTTLVAAISAHSWISCTDYLEQNGEYFAHEFCRAYPRMASQYAPNGGLHGGVSTCYMIRLICLMIIHCTFMLDFMLVLL